MAYKINIYGDIVAFDRKENECDLSFVQSELDKANGQDLTVGINSFGGDVDEGFAIYTALRRYKKENNATVTTRNEGRCSSIATVIFLAGDVRIASPYIDPFVHEAHSKNKSPEMEAELIKCNSLIANHYASHTDLSFDEALELMSNNTYISPEECVALRFATEVEQIMRPVALQKLNPENHKNNKMTKEKQTWLKNFILKIIFLEKEPLK